MMKRLLFVLFLMMFSTLNIKADQIDVPCTPGDLADSLKVRGYWEEPDSGDGTAFNTLKNITSMTISGQMDARDFQTIKYLLNLQTLDLSAVDIVAYQGTGGTYNPSILVIDRSYDYQPKTIPIQAFQVGGSSQSFLGKVVLPPDLIDIEYSAFSTTAIESIDLPESLQTIGNDVFFGCPVLKTLRIPANVSSIGTRGDNITDMALAPRSPLLEEIQVADGNTHYWAQDGVLFSKDGYLCEYPNGKSNKEYKIPEGTRIIANDSFTGSKLLESLTIPASVTRIENAFAGCYGLTKLTCEGTTSPQLAAYGTTGRVFVFESCGWPRTLIVPAGCRAEYFKNNWGMEKFRERLEQAPEQITYRIELPTTDYVQIQPEKGYDPAAVVDGQEFIFSVIPDENHQLWTITVKANGVILEASSDGKYHLEKVTEDVLITVELQEPPQVNYYTVTFPSLPSLTFVPLDGYDPLKILAGNDFKFNVITGKNIVVRINGRNLNPVNGIYTIADIMSDQIITVDILATEVTKNVQPGKLNEAFITEEFQIVTHLTITGSISEDDFEVLRTSFDKLTTLDLTNVTITTSLRANLGAILPAKALAGNKTLEIISLPRTLTSIGQEAFSGCKNLKEMSVHTTTPPEMGADVFKDVPLAKANLFVPAGSRAAYKSNNLWAAFGSIDDGYTYFTVSKPDIQNGVIEISPEQDEYAEGTTLSVRAIPSAGYSFLKWEDGITTAERSFVIDENLILPQPVFLLSSGNETIQSKGIRVYTTADKRIVVEQSSESVINIRIFDLSGRLVCMAKNQAIYSSYTVPGEGMYIILINGLSPVKLNCF